MGEGRAEREREKSEPGSRLWAASTELDVGLELTDHKIKTWAEVRCLTDWATQAPHALCILIVMTNFPSKHSHPFTSPPKICDSAYLLSPILDFLQLFICVYVLGNHRISCFICISLYEVENLFMCLQFFFFFFWKLLFLNLFWLWSLCVSYYFVVALCIYTNEKMSYLLF